MVKQKQKLLVITAYPSKKHIHDAGSGGISSYAKNTILAMSRVETTQLTDIHILADEMEGEKGYKEKNVTVKRIWKKNSHFSFPKLLIEIVRNYKDSRNVVIEFEHAMFGTTRFLLLFPVFLFLLKILGKSTTVVSHQIISNMKEIGPHINVSSSSKTAVVMNIMLGLFYRTLLLTTSKVIVFEEKLKDRLSKFGNSQKIKVIPHGVQEFKDSPSKKSARKQLDIPNDSFVLLLFGYLGWYKGTDWVIQTINELKKQKNGKKIELIIAGGPNPNLVDKPYYTRYIGNIKKICEENDIRITGRISEGHIPLYFQASDVVLLPYRSFMSASGPLSLALSFKKPFLLSPKVKDALETADIKEILRKTNMRREDVHFKDFNGDLSKKIARIRKSEELQKKLTLLSSLTGKARSWDLIGKRYHEELFN